MRWVGLSLVATLGGCIVDPVLATTKKACRRPDRPVVEVPEGALTRTYLVDHLDLPDTPTEASQFGFNIDEDPMGRPDNALGQVLATILSQGAGDIDGSANEAIALGKVLHLFTVGAIDLTSSDAAEVTLRHGVDLDGDPTDNFSGTEAFGIDATRGEGRLGGSLDEGMLVASGGTLLIELAHPDRDETALLTLVGAQLEARVTADGLEGRVGGGSLDEGMLAAVRAELE